MEQHVQELGRRLEALTQHAEQQQAIIEEMTRGRVQAAEQMVALQARMLDLTVARPTRVTFVDLKGIGKPSNYSGDPRTFAGWAFKLGNFLEGIVAGMKKALEVAADHDEPIEDPVAVTTELPAGTDVRDVGRQLYAVLAQLCENEALDLVQTTQDSNGWEAWRVISRRFDPVGAGRRRGIMSQLLQPGSYDIKDLTSAMAKWEDKVRVYERRAARELPDDVKCSVLTEMCKGALRDHLLLNASKLRTYQLVREEVQCYLESKHNQEAVPMDIGAFHKGKGKGKGGGQNNKEKSSQDRDTCTNCGKKGHWKRDCRAPGGGAATTSSSSRPGSGSSTKGRGKKGGGSSSHESFEGYCVNCWRWGHKVADCRSQPSKGKGKIGKKGRGMNTLTTDEPEIEELGQDVGGLDLCAFHYQAQDLNFHADMVEATVDSGAAVCVMPREMFDHVPVRPSAGSERGTVFRTASGEEVKDEGQRTIEVMTEQGERRRLTCTVTRVKKMLLAVSRLVETGHTVHFGACGRSYAKHEATGKQTPIYLKNGVYVMRFRVPRGRPTGAKDLAAMAPSSGGRRQA